MPPLGRAASMPRAARPAVGKLLGLGVLVRLIFIDGNLQASVLASVSGNVEHLASHFLQLVHTLLQKRKRRGVARDVEEPTVHDGVVHDATLLPRDAVLPVVPRIDLDVRPALLVQGLCQVADEEHGFVRKERVRVDQIAFRDSLVLVFRKHVGQESVSGLHLSGDLAQPCLVVNLRYGFSEELLERRARGISTTVVLPIPRGFRLARSRG
mmetsp:Transcript_15456/g.58771  ORF Transcript_15456/g.58771 Transcript_15456/m.58771 type:complete len:211 (-) Transcript_15456:912-1544(-)